MQKRATITSKGQITVPREVRRMLGVRSGDKLLFESDDKGVRIRPIKNRSAFSKYRGIGNPEIPSGRKNIGKWLRGDEGRMTTAVDANVVIASWDKDSTLSLAAQNALDAAFNRGPLVAAAPAFAELIAAPGRSETFVGSFFEETGIGVDGSGASKFGDWRDGHFKPMQSGVGSSAIRVRAVSLRTSSSALMHLQTDSAFSPSTRAYIGQPSPALLLRPSENPKSEQSGNAPRIR